MSMLAGEYEQQQTEKEQQENMEALVGVIDAVVKHRLSEQQETAPVETPAPAETPTIIDHETGEETTLEALKEKAHRTKSEKDVAKYLTAQRRLAGWGF